MGIWRFYSRALLCLLVCFQVACANAQGREIRLYEREPDQYHRVPLLQQALETASSHYGPTHLTLVKLPTVYEAEEQLLKNDGKVDAFIGQLNAHRESQFHTIYIPLDRGMAGFRLCLIQPNNQARFARLNQVSDISEDNLKVIVGSFWNDRNILEYNGIDTAHADTHGQLSTLLATNEGHCFNRALSEILVDQSNNPEFAIENNLALIYPAAMVVYVRPDKPELVELLSYGLESMLSDGSFNELFEEKHHSLFTSLDFYSRKLFFLDNPNLTDEGREAINRYGIASFVPLASR